MKTVVGLFPNSSDAQQTASELMQMIGISPDDIGMVTGRDFKSDNEALGELSRNGVPDDVARRYVAGLHHGAVMETVRVGDDSVPRALEIMNRHTSSRSKTDIDQAAASEPSGEIPSLSVIEEELVIGKQTVERGAVRARTKVSSKPVEQDVKLREEKVDVERRPVNRPAQPGEAAFAEKTIEFVEKGEEPVVAKQARVVEEVELKKDIGESTRRVADTVRKVDVEVERVPFDAESYRSHFNETYGATGENLESYKPAYKYGQSLRTDQRYGQADWSRAETSAKERWEKQNPGTWERFKAAIKHAFEKK